LPSSGAMSKPITAPAIAAATIPKIILFADITLWF
jgi:hypothetical protein